MRTALVRPAPRSGGAETGFPHAKHRRIIVNRERQLELIEEDLPTPGPGEVRLKMLAAGVSFADVSMIQGIHPEARREPFTPGWDVVGAVDALGEGVDAEALGTTVAAMPIVGGYAEYLCLPATELIPVPPQLDPAEAVCLILNYVTAYQMLHRLARARPGESALIHGAAGGVGTALLQLARLHGVQTYGTASAGKLKIIESFGGHAIDYKRSDFLKEIRSLPRRGVDIVFDGIGGWNLLGSWRALTTGGRLVAYGLISSLADGRRELKRFLSSAAGWAAVYTLGLLSRRKKLHIYSIQMLKRRQPGWFRQDLTTLFDLLARGDLKPVIDRKLPLEQAALGHELLVRGDTVGKIVLAVAGLASRQNGRTRTGARGGRRMMQTDSSRPRMDLAKCRSLASASGSWFEQDKPGEVKRWMVARAERQQLKTGRSAHSVAASPANRVRV